MLSLKPGGELRQRLGGFDAQLVWAVKDGIDAIQAQARHEIGRLGLRHQTALLAHRRPQKGIRHDGRLGTPCRHDQAAMDNGNPGLVDDPGPNITSAHGPLPMRTCPLPADGDEAEIADRGTDRLGVTLDDNDFLALAHSGQRNADADNARTNNRKIIPVRHRLTLSSASIEP